MTSAIAVTVQQVYKTFKLPHERHTSLKSSLLNIGKRKKGYERQQVLKDISFDVLEGDFFAIVGRNGSGKSTLLKMLAGIYVPNKGAIHVNGKLTPFIELGVGFNPDLTGRENVYLNGALLGFSRKEMNAMYDDIVEFAEIERFMDQKLKNYSSGMQVRLAFSIAIRARGDILLLDEVLAVGDAAFQQKCFNYFEELKANKKTVIFVSHDMGAIKRFCNKAVYIRDGELISVGSPVEIADLYTADNLESAHQHLVGAETKSEYELSAKLEEQRDNYAKVEFKYRANKEDSMYIGLSVLKDGLSAAEITTPLDLIINSEGKVTYTIDTSNFNPGVYEVTAVLCHTNTRELEAFTKERLVLTIKGDYDKTKGGAMKLADTWKIKK